MDSLVKFCDDNKWKIIALATILPSLYFLRRKVFAGTRFKGEKRLDGKNVIITGANTGIGKAIALDLAKRGARVILACRDVKKAIKAADEIRSISGNGNVLVEYLDLSLCKSVYDFAEKIKKQEEQINILINNAGIMSCPRLYTQDGFEMQFGVNYMGHFLLTNLLLDKMKSDNEQQISRIINISSKLYETGKIDWDDLNSEKDYNPLNAYKQSKLCIMLFTHELAKRLKDTNIRVFSVSPGIVLTELGRYHRQTYGLLSTIKLYLLAPLILYCLRTPTEGNYGIFVI